MTEVLSAYELQRLQHIQRNIEYMQRLGIAGGTLLSGFITPKSKSASNGEDSAKKKRKSAIAEAVEQGERRRSSRLEGKAADYTGTKIIHDFVAEGGENSSESGVPPVVAGEKRRRVVDYEDALENSKQWLEESREALLRLGALNNDGKRPESNNEWQQEAQRRWGDKVVAPESGNWETYVLSRMSTPPPASELSFLQEYYAHDVWSLLCACLLMSRVASHDIKHNTISDFFARYSTPSEFIDANPDEVLSIIKPLGLFANRMQGLVALTRKFLEMPIWAVGLDKENKIYGIGEFGYQSYLIFCRNEWATLARVDPALQRFVEWQRRNASAEKTEE